MLIEYYATPQEDDLLLEWMHKLNITYTEAFNPQDYYYIIESDDERLVTVMSLLGIELYVVASAEKIVGGSAEL